MFAFKFLGRHWDKIILLLLAFYILGPTNEINDAIDGYIFRASLIKHTLERGKLAPFPKSAVDFSIHESSSWFHHSVSGSFSDKPEVIRDWLKSSPGFRECLIETGYYGTSYLLKTNDNGGHACRVIVSPSQDHASFRVGD